MYIVELKNVYSFPCLYKCKKKERMQNTKVRHVLMETMVIIIEIYCC